MKKIILLLSLLIICNNNLLFSQTLNDSLAKLNNVELGHYYSQRAKHQKTGAWVMFGGGLAMMLGGYGWAMSDFSLNLYGYAESSSSNDEVGPVALFFVGAGLLIGSIPVALAAGRNKRKAKLLLSQQNTPITSTFYIKQSGIGIAIPLGK